jgi:KDO2-lipid IV(A) lauroyltransferase
MSKKTEKVASALSPRNILVWCVAQMVLWISAVLPLTISRAVGRALGWLSFHAHSRSRRVAEISVGLAYPTLTPRERGTLVQQTLLHSGMLAMELGPLWKRPWRQSQQLIVAVEGRDLITDALSDGRGVIILAPHLGNWEVIGLHLASCGETVALYQRPKIASLGGLIRKGRQQSGSTLVATDSRGLARLVRNVKAGGISGILPDQVPDDDNAGRNVPFFGIPCFTASLACNLIRRAEAVALVGVAYRVPGGFRVTYRRAEEAVYSDDLEVALTAMNREVERSISGYEAQYQWQYKRFRCRGEPSVNHYRNTKR